MHSWNKTQQQEEISQSNPELPAKSLSELGPCLTLKARIADRGQNSNLPVCICIMLVEDTLHLQEPHRTGFHLTELKTLIQAMARRKAAPLQREPSDFDRGPPESPNHGWKSANGNPTGSPTFKDGTIEKARQIMGNGTPKDPSPLNAMEQPGIIQLLVCVAGIYASLYDPAISFLRCIHSNISVASLGQFYKNVSSPPLTAPPPPLPSLNTPSFSTLSSPPSPPYLATPTCCCRQNPLPLQPPSSLLSPSSFLSYSCPSPPPLHLPLATLPWAT